MQHIDFRNEYSVVSVISFAATFLIFVVFTSVIEIGTSIPEYAAKFFLSLGLYLAIFKSLLWLFNKYLWRYFGYKDIDVAGHWHYRSYKSTTQTNTEGYAYIAQDMYGIQIYGFNVGSAGDKKAIAMWKTDNVNISRGVLNYVYELFAERPKRVSRVMKSNVALNLYGTPPDKMVGTYIDLPIASIDETIRSNLVGSIIFTKCNYEELSYVVKELFENMPVEKTHENKSSTVGGADAAKGTDS